MASPNNFEKAIMDAAKAAQKFHIKMTDGTYLWYSHESFLQNFIAMEMFKNKKMGHPVYIDASPKKIREALYSPDKKEPKNQRFDLVFWLKDKYDPRVKAIVEIKVRQWKQPVMKDLKKVKNYLKDKDGKNVDGYVLWYDDQRGDQRRKDNQSQESKIKIKGRFREIGKEKKVELRGTYIHEPEGKDPWGFALCRCYR